MYLNPKISTRVVQLHKLPRARFDRGPCVGCYTGQSYSDKESWVWWKATCSLRQACIGFARGTPVNFHDPCSLPFASVSFLLHVNKRDVGAVLLVRVDREQLPCSGKRVGVLRVCCGKFLLILDSIPPAEVRGSKFR